MKKAFRHRRGGIRFLWLVLVIALVIGAWQLSSLFQTNAFNVRATVKDSSPGLVQAITNWSVPEASDSAGSGDGGTEDEGTGSVPEGTEDNGAGSGPPGPEDKGPGPESGGGGSPPPGPILTVGQGNLIYINTDILYGTVFPGEILTDNFTVHLKDNNVSSTVTYTVNMTFVSNSNIKDMRPYLIVEKRASAGDSEDEPDSTANGTDWTQIPRDYIATGNLTDGSDEFDIWLVTFYVPDGLGDYEAKIVIIPNLDGKIYIKPD